MVISTYYYHHYSFFSDVIVDHRDSQVQSRSWIETQLVEKENLFVNVFNWIWPSKQPEGRKRERVRSILINAHRKSLLLYIFWLINDKLVQMIKRKWETKIGFRGGGRVAQNWSHLSLTCWRLPVIRKSLSRTDHVL